MIVASPACEPRARGFLLDAQVRVLDAQALVLFGQAFDPRSSAQSVLQRSFLLDRQLGELFRQGSGLRRQSSALHRQGKKPFPQAFLLGAQGNEACTARL